MERITVFVADDHPLVRDGIVTALRSDPSLEVVGAGGDGRDALARIRELKPAVALVDLKMPGLDGTELARAVAREALETKVVVLSAFTDSAIAYRALERGAAGFISKDADARLVCEAVRAAHRGETVLSPEVQSGVAKEIRLRGRRDQPALSNREREVLTLTAEGLSAPAIGERLFLSTATVKGHLQNVYEKLGVSDRAAAVAEAMRQGLLE